MAKKQIDKKYMWDFSEVFATQEDFDKGIKKLQAVSKKIKQFEGKIAKADKDTYLKFYEANRKQEELQNKLLVYSYKYTAQMNDQQALKNMSTFKMVEQQVTVLNSWIPSEIRKLGEKKILSFIEGSKKYAHLVNSVKEYFRLDRFHLKEKDEKFAANFGKLFSSTSTIYTQLAFADKKFQDIEYGKDKDGKLKTVKLTEQLMGEIEKNSHIVKDQELRQKVGHLKNKAVADLENTYCELYGTLATTSMTLARLKGYKSALNAGLHHENLPEEVYLNFIKNAYKHSHLLYDYYMIHRRELKTRGAKKYFSTDRRMPILPLEKKDLTYTVDQGLKVCLDVLKPLGEEYFENLKDASKFGRIDYHEREGKNNGGFSMSTKDTPSYILMNWSYDYQALFILIHELGHSTHSNIAKKHNKPAYSRYSILVAEVASTFCELLLNRHLLKKHENNRAIKAYLLQQTVRRFETLYFSVAREANFEYLAKQAAFEGKSIDKIYLQNLAKSVEFQEKIFDTPKKEFYGNRVELSWPSILHHYTTFFYLYKYALSFVVSCNLYIDYVKTGDPSKFLNLLRAGGSDHPLALIKKHTGVDLTDIKSHQKLFDLFTEVTEEFKGIFVSGK